MVTLRFLSGAALVLAQVACSAPDQPVSPGARSSADAARPGARARGAAAAPDATAIDLEAMLAPVPEYQGAGRNLFAYGAARGPDIPVVEALPPDDEPMFEDTPPPPPPAPAPSSRLNMKYAGFLEKTRPDGEKAKYAIFLDGNEILAGAEGETLMNRFTIVEIGLESVTVSASGSRITQRIPLQSN